MARWTIASSPTGDRLLWPAPEDAGTIYRGLQARLLGLGVRPEAADDAASEAFAVMAQAIASGRVSPDGNPSAYLLSVARRRAIDAWRRESSATRRAERDSVSRSPGDHAVTDLIDGLASRQVIDAALRRADPTTRRVVAAFLDLAALEGQRPAAHVVAAAADVSRKTYFQAVARFRALIEQVETDPG